MRKKLVRHATKIIKEVKEFISKNGKEFKDGTKKYIFKKYHKFIKVAEEVIEQQKEMIATGVNRVINRIVSLHKPEIRPIFRGKIKQPTEFGQKININVIGNKVAMITNIDTENVSDTKQIKTSIEKHKEITGKPPREYGYDKGGHSPDNHRLMDELGIVDGIQYRGRIPKKANLPIKNTRQRLYKSRAGVEGYIGILKRKYGLDKNTFSVNNGLNKGIFGTITMNYTLAVR